METKYTSLRNLIIILVSLIFLSLHFSCNSSKRDNVIWLKENFEKNNEAFFNLTNIFNNLPLNLKKDNSVVFSVNNENNSVEIMIQGKKVLNGKTTIRKSYSHGNDRENFNQMLTELGWTMATVDSLQNLLKSIRCNSIRNVDYKYYDVEIYNTTDLSHSYLHIKPDTDLLDINVISDTSKYGNQFSLIATSIL